ncbi:MAG TPA: HK97 gp10 family phage protein [Mycobacterium sp.]
MTGKNTFTVGVDMSGLDAYIDELGDKADKAARPAAQAAAQVLYDEVKKNVAALRRKTGNLDRSIYQAFSKSNSSKGIAVYHVSWNHKVAPHGWLVENGYLQRYRYYQGSDGKVRPMVRPGMDGQPRPSRGASQAVKDAYYVTLPTPVHVPAKAFVRRAQDKFPMAALAAEDAYISALLKRG